MRPAEVREGNARWRLRHDNGEIMPAAGRATPQAAREPVARSVKTNARGAPVEEGE
ncbi:DUF1508 domain-containing protein [Haloferax sp. wsp5]|nr:DUF1508 domain-containing protein [Haloferax sp. wsp5]